MSEKWYRLDNAAKIFPAVATNRMLNNFRLEVILKEDVKEEFLPEAVKLSLERFPMYCVKIRRGVFWYYFEHNDGKPLIRKESIYLFNSVYTDEHNRFLFAVEYAERKISLEMFHALSDANGGIEFLKTIVYYYLQLAGKKIENTGEILTNDVELLSNETQDSFVVNYDKNIKAYPNEEKAYKIEGVRYPDNWVGTYHLNMSVANVKEVAHKYGLTITEYFGSVILYVIYKNYMVANKKLMPYKLFVPVNARKLFDSRTLRNFVLYIRTGLSKEMISRKEPLTFEEITKIVKEGFFTELDKEQMKARLVSKVKIEKNFLIRIIPLFIKIPIMKICYKIMGGGMTTIGFSNIGSVKIPQDMESYIDKFRFMNDVCNDTPMNLTAVSFKDNLSLSFNTCLQERTFIKNFTRFLTNEGLNIILETNDLEV